MKTLKDFADKKEFLKHLVETKKERIEFKKSVLKFADPFGVDLLQSKANKALNTSYKDNLESGIIRRSIIGNTYNWLDSHDDVHLNGVFSKSIAQRQDKIFHLHDHEQKITAKVGKPVSIYEKTVEWKDLGIDKAGKTMALFMDSDIMKDWNKQVFDQYLSKEINQHSVGMYYVTLSLAVNDAEEKEEYAEWLKTIDLIGNKEKAIEQGYFWAVSEAKLAEISCVLAGSNELTPTVENSEKEVKESFYSRLAKELSK